MIKGKTEDPEDWSLNAATGFVYTFFCLNVYVRLSEYDCLPND